MRQIIVVVVVGLLAWLLPEAEGVDLALAPWIIPAGISAIQAIRGLKKEGAAQDNADAALDLRKQQYAESAPLRNAFQQRALGGMPQRPNLSPAFEDTSNPFYRKMSPVDIPMGPPTGAQPPTQGQAKPRYTPVPTDRYVPTTDEKEYMYGPSGPGQMALPGSQPPNGAGNIPSVRREDLFRTDFMM